MPRTHLFVAAVLSVLTLPAQTPPKPPPAQTNAAYGDHERNVLDFWKAESAQPSPLVLYFHGGGFRRGDKSSIGAALLSRLLGAGISVAAVNYRLVPADPLPAAYDDARRALQFLRSKSKDWHIDPARIGVTGSSAGAMLSFYLAFHDDMAQTSSGSPLLRQSTRVAAIAAESGPTTMDMDWWAANIPGYRSPPRTREEIFGSASDDRVRAIIKDISALHLVSKDDPPLFMSYQMGPTDPAPAEPQQAMQWMMHHVRFGLALKEHMDTFGLESHIAYPGSEAKFVNSAAFLIEKLARRP